MESIQVKGSSACHLTECLVLRTNSPLGSWKERHRALGQSGNLPSCAAFISVYTKPLRNGRIQWSWRSLLPKWFCKSMILWNTGKYWMCLRLFFWRNSRVRSISCGSYHKIFLCTTKDQESSRCNKSPTSYNYTDVNNGHVEASPFTFCKAFSLVSISISHQIKHWTGEDTRLP